MVLRLQKLQSFDTADSYVQPAMSEDQALSSASSEAKLTPEQTTEQATIVPPPKQQQRSTEQTTEQKTEQTTVTPPPQTTSPPPPSLHMHTTIDEGNESPASHTDSETVVGVTDDTVSELGCVRSSGFLHLGRSSSSLDSSFEDSASDWGISRDCSNTWSHSAFKFRTAKLSGSLPPMDGLMSHVPKLNLSEGRDSPPFPTNTSPCVVPRRNGKMLVCSEHRMSNSPRLPPIGCGSDLHSPRSLPINTPKELTREVTVIDPALVDSADPTEVRMIGRRRNAIMTPQPSGPESGAS